MAIPKQVALVYIDGRWDFEYSSRDKGNMCKVRFCRNDRPVSKRPGGRVYQEPICDRCKCRRWVANNPEKPILKMLRRRAKDRNVPFDLTVETLREIPGWPDYLLRRGVTAGQLHIDRIKTHLGYVPGNLQILTCSDNVAKGNRERNEDTDTIEIPW